MKRGGLPVARKRRKVERREGGVKREKRGKREREEGMGDIEGRGVKKERSIQGKVGGMGRIGEWKEDDKSKEGRD